MSFNPEIHEKIIVHGVEKGYRLKQVEQPAPAMRIISVGSYRRRFTVAEKVAIKTSGDPTLAVLEEDVLASSYIDLDHADTIAGLQYMQSVGIISAERVAEIRADGQPHESPEK